MCIEQRSLHEKAAVLSMVIMNMFKKNNGLLPFGIKSANSLLASLDNGTSHAHPYIPYVEYFIVTANKFTKIPVT